MMIINPVEKTKASFLVLYSTALLEFHAQGLRFFRQLLGEYPGFLFLNVGSLEECEDDEDDESAKR